VRIIHSRIEGEPLPDRPNVEQEPIAHVLFEGHDRVTPLGLSLLRKVPQAPIDVEVMEIVADLKRRLSKRNMRYVIDQLTVALGQE
jgi:hypothetical protein